MKKIILALILAPSVFASPMKIGTSNVCETGSQERGGESVCVCEVQKKSAWNKHEYGFYKAGCQAWLGKQRCDIKKVIDEGTDVTDIFPKADQVKDIKIGYVGHWASSAGTVNYLERRLLPIVEKYNVPLFYDNTACSGASDPIAVTNYIQSLPEKYRNKITIKANQNVSVGEWDGLLKPFIRSNVEITMCSSGLEVPQCKSFANKGCSVFLNHNDTLGCIDKGSQFHVLRCIRKDRKAGKRITKLEIGNWKEADFSAANLEIVEIPADRVMPSPLVRIESEYLVTDRTELVAIGWEDEESVTFTDSQTMHIPYDVAMDPLSVESQEYLVEMVGGHWNLGYDSRATKVTITEVMTKITPIEGEFVYALRSSNRNFKTRISSKKELIEFFADQKSVVSNYFMMHRDPIESEISNNVRSYLHSL